MRHFDGNAGAEFERAVVVISLDAEQIWGYLDVLDEWRFCRRYPDVTGAYDRVLDRFCDAGVSATWALVGGLSLDGMEGPRDARLQGLPHKWIAAIRAGTEASAPVWYRRSFAQRLRAAHPKQEIALHGGLTHLIWTDPQATPGVVECEIAGGVAALKEVSVRPRSFIFPRQRIAHLELLPAYGISSYRGCSPGLSDRLQSKIPRAIVRAVEELGRWVPSVVWPVEDFPGLWNIPASLSLYPIPPSRTRVVPIRTRIERVARGLDAAIRSRGIFHYWFHPDNLAESPGGFPMLDEMLEKILRARDAGDIEVLTMAQVVDRMDSIRSGQTACTVLETRAGDSKPALSFDRVAREG